MLLGHSDSYTQDKDMQVTIAFNHFGEGLVQRMPRYAYMTLKILLFIFNTFYFSIIVWSKKKNVMNGW
jgi:pectate lyase